MVHVKFFFAIVWSVQLNLTLRDPAPDDLRNKMEGKNKPGGIEIYKHGGNGAEIQWNSCDNGLRKPPFEILEQIMFESLVDNLFSPFVGLMVPSTSTFTTWHPSSLNPLITRSLLCYVFNQPVDIW